MKPLLLPSVLVATMGFFPLVSPWAQSNDNLPAIECLLNWAEANYPGLFSPAGFPTASWDVYRYRYYVHNNVYLGVSSLDSHVYYQDVRGHLQDEGPLSYWLPVSGCQAATPTVYENTRRSGPIRADEIWRGVIDITGDVGIYAPATLTIEPGTVVRFAAGSDDQRSGGTVPITDTHFPHDPAIAPSQMSTINVFGGTLYAVGTPDRKILFTSSSKTAQPGDWHSLQYNQSGSKFVLQYATLEYAYYGVQISDKASDSEVTISHNTIRNIVACGICNGVAETGPVTISLSDNDISYCGHEGIDTHSNAALTIANNIFHDNWTGIVVDHNNSTIRHNQFLRNSAAIYIIDGNPNTYGNSFVDNGMNCNTSCQ